MTEQIHPVETQPYAQRFDVGDEPVTAVRRRIPRHGGAARAPGIEHDQLPVRREAAQLA